MSDSEKAASLQSDTAPQGPASTAKPEPIADTFEAIDIEGQKETGIWVHHPGSEVAQTWEPRRGKNRLSESQILSVDISKSSLVNDSTSSSDDSKEDHKDKRGNILQRSFNKIFHRHEGEDQVKSSRVIDPSPRANVKATHVKKVGVNLVVDDDDLSGPLSFDGKLRGGSSNEGSGVDNSGKHDKKGKAKDMLKNTRNPARRLRDSFSRKGSKKNIDISDEGVPLESDSSDEDSFSSSLYHHSIKGVPICSSSLVRSGKDEVELKENVHTNDPPKGSVNIPVRKSSDSSSG